MSNKKTYHIFSNSTQEIMEYLIKKLESRKRNLSNYIHIFDSIDSIEIFYQKKNEISLLFKNLEEELHQSALAIKALMIENKALSHESIEASSIQSKYNKLLKENNFLLLENNFYERKFNHFNNNKVKSPKIEKSTFNKGLSKNKFNISNKNKHTPLKKAYSSKMNRIKNYNTKGMKKNNNNLSNDYDYNLDLNETNQLKNVKKIIKDMISNKNKLKEIINEHFKSNQKKEK